MTKQRKPLKVRVTLVVTIDRNQYDAEYGHEADDTIRDYVRYAARDAAENTLTSANYSLATVELAEAR